jgi:transcriptional antiterminator RfaH
MNQDTAQVSSRWYAIHTKARQEDRADSNLRAWRVKTFAPKIKERRYNEYSGKASYLVKPLFPGYIFARFKLDDLLHKIKFTRGVNNVVAVGGMPAPIDDEVMEVMLAREGADGFVRMGEELQPGDKVIIRQGILRNFIGIFQRYHREEERVSILLETVSYQNRLIVERGAVKKIA